MRYVEVAPGSSLAEWVECFWTLEHDGEPTWERVLPDGRPEVLIHFGDAFVRRGAGGEHRQAQALLAGNITEALHLRPTGTVGIVGARLFPHAVPALFGALGGELIDLIVALNDVVGREGDTLAERVLDEPSREGRIARLAEFLVFSREKRGARDSGVGGVGGVVRRLLASAGDGSVDAALAAVGRSRRHVERLFRRDVGIGPKRLSRIVRFQRVVGAMAGDPAIDLAALAARTGYADQAHMTREFREFAGVPPRAYLRERHSMSDHFAMGTDGVMPK